MCSLVPDADGHELTYFRSRIPTLGVPRLLNRLAELPTVGEEVERSRARHGRPAAALLRWKLTLNRYPPSRERVGFPWHRDLVANGACSLILNLGATGALEFGAEEGERVDGLRYSSDHAVLPGAQVPVLQRVSLDDGDLLVMTGRARWEALHRVVPTEREHERISLVWGAW